VRGILLQFEPWLGRLTYLDLVAIQSLDFVALLSHKDRVGSITTKSRIMNILKSVREILKRRTALQKEIESIDKMLEPFGVKPGKSVNGRRRKRGPMSAAARARISAAAKARWKKAKAAGKNRL